MARRRPWKRPWHRWWRRPTPGALRRSWPRCPIRGVARRPRCWLSACCRGVDEEAFWRLFEAWVPQGVKALLGTFLKAAALRYRAGRLSLADGRLHRFAREVAGSVDKQKLLAALMPAVRSGDDALRLLALAEGLPLAPLARTLMRCGTPPAYFCLLRALQSRDAPPQTLRACCLMLMKEGSRLAFNMASIVAAYFGLDALPGTFSLALPPYELSRLDASYEQFEKLLLRV